MNETKPIEFQREKQRLSLSLVISVICVGVGLFVAINPNDILQIADSDTSSLPFGIGLMAFSGYLCVVNLKRFLDKSPGLILNEEGIFEDITALGVGLVYWSDILEVKEIPMGKNAFIELVVKNPQDYINKQTTPAKRNLMQDAYNSGQGVILFSANGLACSYQELKAAIDERFLLYKNISVQK